MNFFKNYYFLEQIYVHVPIHRPSQESGLQPGLQPGLEPGLHLHHQLHHRGWVSLFLYGFIVCFTFIINFLVSSFFNYRQGYSFINLTRPLKKEEKELVGVLPRAKLVKSLTTCSPLRRRRSPKRTTTSRSRFSINSLSSRFLFLNSSIRLNILSSISSMTASEAIWIFN